MFLYFHCTSVFIFYLIFSLPFYLLNSEQLVQILNSFLSIYSIGIGRADKQLDTLLMSGYFLFGSGFYPQFIPSHLSHTCTHDYVISVG